MIDYATFNRNLVAKVLQQATGAEGPPMPEGMAAPTPVPAPVAPTQGPVLANPTPPGGSIDPKDVAPQDTSIITPQPLVILNKAGGGILILDQNHVPDQLPEGYSVGSDPISDPIALSRAYNDPNYIRRQPQEVQALFGYGQVEQGQKPSALAVEGGPPITSAVYGSPTDIGPGVTGVNTRVTSPDAAVRILASAPDGTYTDDQGNPVPASYWADLLKQAEAGTFDLTTMQPVGEGPVTSEQMTPAEQAAALGEPLYQSRQAVQPSDYMLAQSTQGGQTITLAMTPDEWYRYYVNDPAWTVVTDQPTAEQIQAPTVRTPTPEDFAIQEQKGIQPGQPEHGATISDIVGSGAGAVKDIAAAAVSPVVSTVTSKYDQAMGAAGYQYLTGNDAQKLVGRAILPPGAPQFLDDHHDEATAIYANGYDRDGDGKPDVEAGNAALWAYMEDNGQGVTPYVTGALGAPLDFVQNEYADAVSKYATGQDMSPIDWVELIVGRQVVGGVEGATSLASVLPNIIGGAIPGAALIPGINPSDFDTSYQDFELWARQNPDQVTELLTNGYQAEDGTTFEPGARAVWEAWIGTQPVWKRGILATVMDPLSYTPAGRAAGGRLTGIGENILREADTGLARGAGRATQIAGEVLAAPYNVVDRPVDATIEAAGRILRQSPLGRALEPSLSTRYATETQNPINQAVRDVALRPPEAELAQPPVAGVAPNPPEPRAPAPEAPSAAPVTPSEITPEARIAEGAVPETQAAPQTPAEQAVAEPRVAEPNVAEAPEVRTEPVPGRQLQPGDSVLVDGSPHRVDGQYDLITPDGTIYGQVRMGQTYDRVLPAPTTAGESINQTLERPRLGQEPQPQTAAPPTTPEGRLQRPIEPPDPEVFTENADQIERRATERTTAPPERVGGIRDQVEGQLAVRPEKQADIERALTYYDRRIAPYLDGARRNMATESKSAIRNELAFTRLLRRASGKMEELAGVPVRPVKDVRPFSQDVADVIYQPWDSAESVAARGRLHRGATLSVSDRSLSRITDTVLDAANGDTYALAKLQNTVEMIDHHLALAPNDPANAGLRKNADFIVNQMEPMRLALPDTRTGRFLALAPDRTTIAPETTTAPTQPSPGAVGFANLPEQRAQASVAQTGTIRQAAREVRTNWHPYEPPPRAIDTAAADLTDIPVEDQTWHGRPLARHEIDALNIEVPEAFSRPKMRLLRRYEGGEALSPEELAKVPKMVRARDKFDELYAANEKAIRTVTPDAGDADVFVKTANDMTQYLDDILRGMKEAKYKTRFGDEAASIYRTMIAMARESILYSPLRIGRYAATQLFGNQIQMMIAGHTGATADAWRHIVPTYKAYREGTHVVRNGLDAPAMIHATDLGISMPDNVLAIVADQVEYNPETVWNRVLPGPARRLSPLVSLKTGRNFAHSIDLSFRLGLHDTLVMRQLPEANVSLAHLLIDNGVDTSAVVNWLTSPEIAGMPTFTDVRRFAREQGLDNADSLRMGRAWQGELNRIRTEAASEVQRVFFYGTTKADEALAGAVMFHYWMTRASALYARHVLTNPALMAGYYRMAQYMEREREAGDVPEWLDNMVKVMTGVYGYDIFANPVAMLETFLFFGGGRFGNQGFVDEDANAFWRFAERTGFMPAAPLAAAMVITGNGGSERVPDPIGISALTRPSTILLNALAAEGFIDPNDASYWTDQGGVFTDPTQESLNFLREITTRVLPWTTAIPDPVEADLYHREINEQIITIARERGIISDDIAQRALAADGVDQTLPAVVLEAINNPNSDLWQAAYKRVAYSDLALEGARANPITGITYPYARPTIRGERDQQRDTLPEGSPERQQLYNETALTNTVSREGTDLTAADQAYRLLGDEQSRRTYQSYVDIAYGDNWQGRYKIGSRTYTYDDLAQMSDDQRQRAADQWAAEHGQTEVIDALKTERDAYQEGNPQYAAFKDWQKRLYDVEGGPVAYWQDIVTYNDNAKWWYDHLRPDQQQSAGALTSVDAYMAFAGIHGNYRSPATQSLDNPAQRPYDPAAPQAGTGQESSGYAPGQIKPEWIVQDIAEYQQEVADYNATLRELFPNEPVNIDLLQPNVRDAVIQNVYDRTGQTPPRLSSRAEEYLVWARGQEQGSDTSIEAWLAWRGQQQDAAPTNAPVTLSDGSVVDPSQYIGSLSLP